MNLARRQKPGRHVSGFFIVLFLLTLASDSAGTNSTRNLSAAEVRITVQESMKAILTGKEYSPELEQRQQTLREMFEQGVVKKAKLEALAEEAILPILDSCKTSRYILKGAAERVQALLSPYMSWEEVKKISWKVGTGMVKDGEQVVLTIGTLAPPGTPWINIPE